MKILLIEDDEKTASYILKGFTSAGHVVDWVVDGRDGLTAGLDTSYDVMIVDRMVPALDGLTLVKSLRAASVRTPVLFLTAMSGVDDRVEGLEAGGDDYLVKPFAFSELTARINALLRRPPMAAEKTKLRVGDLELDLVKRTAERAGVLLELLPREFTLLELLMRNEGRVLTKTMLLERIWNFNFDPQSSVVETHISRLRSKIDKPFDFPLLHTVRNTGYSLHARR
ncbi:Putative Two-component transcriptional regulator; transcriptional regulator involved in heavy-metal (Cu/Zn) homeostasis [Neorhizobium galegae bv. officinalis bv. officinalis str. HAMBI 1141]|uniref:Putative Two-component transcriptional regulator transcriptional regulator involved in heavy-metal (Cu/Zn) homeostasis n=1 Tax=Neorhizobium galegae bv. officinalis bv. officinalis str. HAMBI 1141 TaxID=1028801 RepID=A0A068T7I2_NEOGA|nr:MULTISPECIES: response regulator transcription factor [Neorhizobium]MCJ9749796.1 response regulator transcription factor [Neorhizobium sp. BETTINA12A]CDN54383.1 Putative Two-component transcriptional regulator; transcriptional regulator involved in heavy-metal (Cu/Zn) homeostasis [Neorhizobium galegae bv. officinalis bv. officinalis str. HAMBI 1141]